MKKYDAVVVLSGNEENTPMRIEEGLKVFYKNGLYFVLNGFNTRDAHDPDFNGDWQNDPRLKNYIEEIKEIHPIILYARTTEENIYELKKVAREQGWKNIAIVSSETHIKRVKRICYKFFPDYLIDFYKAPEPNEKIRKRLVLKEMFANFMTWIEFYGLPIAQNPETDAFNYKVASKRKEKFEPLNNLIKRILKLK